MVKLTTVARTALRDAIDRAYSKEELDLLCGALDEDPENIPGHDKGKLYYVEQIILYLERREDGDVNKLVSRLIQERPRVAWWQIVAEDTSPSSSPSIRPTTPGKLSMLVAQVPDLHDAMMQCSADLQYTYDHIHSLSNYKELHDQFQQLDDTYQVIYQAAKRLPADDTAWDDIAAAEPDAQAITTRLLATASQVAGVSAGALWTSRLSRAASDLSTAVKASDLSLLHKASAAIDKVTSEQLSRLNVNLVSAAKEVKLGRLVGLLASVRDRMTALNLAVANFASDVQRFSQGVDDLKLRDVILTALTQQHDGFQQADDELRRIQAQLAKDLSELESVWTDLKPMLQKLWEGHTDAEKWAQDLAQTASELEAALSESGKNPRRIRNAFNRYCAQTTQRFNQVNADLVTQCRQLRQVDGPLAVIWNLVA